MKKNDGSGWKNEVTKPCPPKITDIIISNLQKKLSENNQKIIPTNTVAPTPKSVALTKAPITLRIKKGESNKT